MLVGQGLGHGRALGVADHGDGQGAGEEGDQVVPADRRQDQGGHGPLDPADDLDPTVGQPEQGDHDDAGNDHAKGRRQGGDDAPGGEQQGQAAEPDRGRPGVGVVEPGERVAELWEEVALAPGTPSSLGTWPTMMVSPSPNMNRPGPRRR